MDTSTGTGETVSQELVEPFVIAAHGDFGKVQELYAAHPEMLNVPWARFVPVADRIFVCDLCKR